MASLFVISNCVQWSEIMYQVSSARGIDLITKIGDIDSVLSAIFFIIMVVIGNFFVMNMFIGVIISKYNRERELNNSDIHLTDA